MGGTARKDFRRYEKLVKSGGKKESIERERELARLNAIETIVTLLAHMQLEKR